MKMALFEEGESFFLIDNPDKLGIVDNPETSNFIRECDTLNIHRGDERYRNIFNMIRSSRRHTGRGTQSFKSTMEGSPKQFRLYGSMTLGTFFTQESRAVPSIEIEEIIDFWITSSR